METGCQIVGLQIKGKTENAHKKKPLQFSNVAAGVQKRLNSNIKLRRSTRLTVFDSGRNLSDIQSPVPEKPLTKAEITIQKRRLQLEKWKEERESRKKLQATQKKKPFVTGTYKAPLKFEPPPPVGGTLGTSTTGRVTRSQVAKNGSRTKLVEPKVNFVSIAPKNATFKPPVFKDVPKINFNINNKPKNDIKVVFKPVEPKASIVLTRSQRARLVANENVPVAITKEPVKKKVKTPKPKTPKKSPVKKKPSKTKGRKSKGKVETVQVILDPAPESVVTLITSEASVCTPNNNRFPKSESNSEEKLRSPKSPLEALPLTPEQINEIRKISPCVTLSRGKENARKEGMMKMKEGLLDEDASDGEGVAHFRWQVTSEVTRITEMCNKWDKISEQNNLPEFVQELVLGAVGQGRLLAAQKLQQFARLVQRCALAEPAGPLVTPADLRGFWDMVFMQIVNIDLKFKKLDELRDRNWAEELPVLTTNAEVKVAKKPAKKAVKPAAGPSKIREMIAAARKAQKQQTEQAPEDKKTFEAGFFRVASPIRVAASPKTPVLATSLLKTVLSSEARKSNTRRGSTPFAMMRASLISKNMEIEGVSPLEITPEKQNIKLNATPARSILKSTSKRKSRRISKKSIKTVLFDDN